MLKKILSSVIIFILLFTVFTVSIPQVKAQVGQIYEFFVPYAPVRLYDNSSDWGDSITFTAFEDGTSIGVDVNVNGTFDYEGVLARGQSANYGVIEGTYVRADKPVSIVVWHWENNYGTWDDGVMTYELLPTSMWGKDYWIPEGGTGLKVVASQSTVVNLDVNNDGVYEQSWSLIRGQVATYPNPPAGTHIIASQPVTVVVYNAEPAIESGTYAYTVLPTELLGTLYYFEGQQLFEGTPTADQTRIRIVGTEDGTTVNGQVINKGQTITIANPQPGLKISSDKKVGVAYVFWKTAPDAWTGTLRDYASAHVLLPSNLAGKEFVAYTSHQSGWAPEYINEMGIVAFENSTEVKIDLNWDGTYDDVKVLFSGETWQYIPPWETQARYVYVVSNKPIMVVNSGSWNTPTWGIEQKHSWVSIPYVFEIPNKPPTANAGGPYYANVNEPIQFLGSGTDPDGDAIIEYAWDFNSDEITDSTLQNPTHSWSVAGTYYPTLKVKDEKGAWSKPNKCTVYVSELFTFIHLTDTHIGWPSAERMFTDAIYEINKMNPKPDFILITGDIAEAATTIFGVYLGYYNSFNNALASLDSPIKIYVVPGNHDRYYNDPLLYWYNKYINGNEKINNNCTYLILPNNYTFEHGGYCFVGLDSGGDLKFLDFRGSGLTDDQLEELKTLNNDIPKIIFMHHPVFNDDPGWIIANNSENFTDYCNENNVQLVLTGHTHESKFFDVKGNQYDYTVKPYPLFIQTPSVSKDTSKFKHGYRIIEIKKAHAYPYPYTLTRSHSKWIDLLSCPANLHVYDSKGRHTGLTLTGEIELNIPDSFYFPRYNASDKNETEMILLYDMNETYQFKIVANFTTEETIQTKTLSYPLNSTFNFTMEKQTQYSLTNFSFFNVPIFENTTATISANSTEAPVGVKNLRTYTMEIDYDGDGEVDEVKFPDYIETNYAPNATIILPKNNSIFVHGDEIAFNGTGIDPEDGVLTNSSLIWTSDIDGIIGIGNEFNTSNLSARMHIITLMANDSTGLTDMDSVEIMINAADLTLNSSDISFSNPNPIEGEIITIIATIHNIGFVNATNVTVHIFDGFPEFQISNLTINSISAGESRTINATWNTTGKIGNHSISVMIDPDDLIEEMNETNNQASKFIVVNKNKPPIASFTYSPEGPIVNQTITFDASNSTDPDGNITNYKWNFGDGNITNTNENIIIHFYALTGDYNVTLTVTDNCGAINSTNRTITVYPLVAIFDTGAPANPYPSIFGTHNGTITPNQTITASKLYTYPCEGTGGHTEYARIWNTTWNATATWEGYKGDWHNITFDKTVVLLANETYNYTIHTDRLLSANNP